ncbi:MAG: hypothetical protein ABR505_08590, partial [Actinomycetota bacterium]
MSVIKGWLERISRTPEEVRAESLRHWRSTLSDTTPIEAISPRQRCRVAGVIQNVRIDPREGTGSIEATVFDGSGELVARWLGRRALSGIRLGTGLIIEGVTGVGDDGE